MMDMSRRGFFGATLGVGAMAVMGAGVASADDAAQTSDWAGTPDDVKALGGCTMPLDELNRRRAEYVDAQTDYTKADGTVVPAVFVKMRALIHTYSFGMGNNITDTSFDFITSEVTEEEAQAFLEMPRGVEFDAVDFAVESGRPLEECQDICESLARKAFIIHIKNDSGIHYNQLPLIQGIGEYHAVEVGGGDWSFFGINGDDLNDTWGETGSEFFVPVPVNKDVVADGGIYLYDDLVEMLKSKEKFSLSPCYCRTLGMIGAGEHFPGCRSSELEDLMSPVCGHRVETCLSIGEEAQYWIDKGVGREITKEQALECLQRSVDEGFILQRTFSKDCETICSCHGDCCGVIGHWKALGVDGVESSPAWQQHSHYTLEVDLDSCVKCGTCEARCPMEAITMDGEHNGESGYPQVNALCFRCGQCAYVCPQGARKLVPRPVDELLPYPETCLDDNNMIAADRFERGLIS